MRTLAFAALLLAPTLAGTAAQAGYVQTNLVANSAAYAPEVFVDPSFQNAWGIAIRPAGFGGHFWVTTNTTAQSVEYVGDVNGTPLFQDDLKTVTIPGPGNAPVSGTPTGVVFNGNFSNFVVTQSHPNGTITSGARFLFATDNGTISGWTERNLGGGNFDRPGEATVVIDRSGQGAQYFGIAISSGYDRLFAANFGATPGIEVFDSSFADITASVAFQNPYEADGYQPFNVQTVGDRLFVAYAKFGTPGEEEPGPGNGRLAEFDFDGNLIAAWDDGGKLDAPWGIALAPSNFGECSNNLLVGNFGDGTIVCFDAVTHVALDYLRDANGDPIAIEGLWDLLFGNGASLGDADSLYFAAGPNDEVDGLFGRIRVAQVPEPGALALLLLSVGALVTARRRRR